MTKIVLDTNNLISAIGWKKGNPRKIFEDCLFGKHNLIESPDLLREFLKVIKRPKFSFIYEEEIQTFVLNLLQMSELVEPKNKIGIIKIDPSDNIVLECAVEGKADYIISGDEHLLKLKEFRGIRIVTAAEFLKLMG